MDVLIKNSTHFKKKKKNTKQTNQPKTLGLVNESSLSHWKKELKSKLLFKKKNYFLDYSSLSKASAEMYMEAYVLHNSCFKKKSNEWKAMLKA